MLHIAVDLRPLLEPFESGVKVYTRAMVQALLRRKDVELDLFYQASKPCPWIHQDFPQARFLQRSNMWFHLRSLFAFPALKEADFPQQPDLIWLPDRRPFFKGKIPLVMTLHDYVPEHFAGSFSFKSRLWHRIFPLPRLLSLCSGLLFPSQSIADEFKGHGLPFAVTYEGAEVGQLQEKPALLPDGRSFFLMIAPADPRKGLDFLCAIAKARPDCFFVVAGLKTQEHRFSRLALEFPPNVLALGAFTEAEKTYLLKHAKALLALSAYEGFDLPVLEAVQHACPVILRDIPVHRELYSGEGFWVKTWQDALPLLDKDLPLVQARQSMSWDSAAEKALLCFSGVVGNKNTNTSGDWDSDDGA